MKISRKVFALGSLLALLVIFGSTVFAHVYLTTRRERVLTAISIPIDGTVTRLHFTVPMGHYVGWFSSTPELHKSTWEPHPIPPEIQSITISMAGDMTTIPDVSNDGMFSFHVPKDAEFEAAEMVISAAQPFDSPLYINIRPSF